MRELSTETEREIERESEREIEWESERERLRKGNPHETNYWT